MRALGDQPLPGADSAALTSDWLAAAAARAPDALALAADGRSLSFAELDALATRAARRLSAMGAGAGSRVALVLPPGVAFAEALYGCWRLGAVAMPIDVRLRPAERAAQVAGAIVVEEPLSGRGGAGPGVREAHRRDEVAVVVHTSGTTDRPRPVELTFGNWEASARAAATRLGHGSAERWLCALPVAHVGGLSILVRSAIHATAAIVHPRFDAEAVARSLADGEATLVSLVPTMLGRLLDAGTRPSASLRCALIGGAPLPAWLADRAAQHGFRLAQTYGATEACSQVATSPIGEPETAGLPLDGTMVRIAPDGEILVAGPTVAPKAVRGDGFLHTGDVGRLDHRGRLIVTGRRAELIVTGGENVAPAEVEAVLESHPAVAEAAVHARPDAEWGEAVVATVVLRAGRRVTESQLRAHCADSLASFKVPKAIAFAAALPRTASGKLRRERLE